MTENEKLAITKYDLYYESRMTKVETTLENLDKSMIEIKHDLRWILGLMFSFAAIFTGIMAKGFHWW